MILNSPLAQFLTHPIHLSYLYQWYVTRKFAPNLPKKRITIQGTETNLAT